MRHALFALALAACSSKGSGTSSGKVTDPPKPDPAKGDVTVELAAVTLADDCGANANLPPPTPTVKTATTTPTNKPADVAAMAPARAAPAAPAVVAPSESCAAGYDCGGGHRQACEQTSMQLSLRTTTPGPTKIEIKRIELLDESGALINELKANAAMKWSEAAGKYEPWDSVLAPGADVAATFALSSPDYGKLGGRWEAHSKKLQLRVTVVVEGKERTVEKKAIAPTMLEPAVPT